MPGRSHAELSTPPPVHASRERRSTHLGSFVPSAGTSLNPDLRAAYEKRFGHRFDDVRIHTGPAAATAAAELNASAFTVGRDIVLGSDPRPAGSQALPRLLAHELAHVLQQRGGDPPEAASERDSEREASDIATRVASSTQSVGTGVSAQKRVGLTVQRDLLAYEREHTTDFPTVSESAWISYEVATADAPALRAALAGLIAAGKIGTRSFEDGTIFFASGATQADVESAFRARGFSRAVDMATALMAANDIQVYSHERVSKISGLWTMETGRRSETLQRAVPRPLTSFERAEATKVFATSLDYDRVRIEEDPVMGAGGIARTTPWTVNFPTGSTSSGGFMPWLIHELTHSWQYQHGVSLGTTFCTAVASWALPNWMYAGYDYGGEPGLRAATAGGRGFRTFNTEQQGDILRDYYRKVLAGTSTAAYDPFVTEVRGLPPIP